jgi:hypothetical protein
MALAEQGARSLLSMDSHEYQLPNGDGGPTLVRIYYAIDLVILFIGMVVWLRLAYTWKIVFFRVSTALQAYIWVFIGDFGECPDVGCLRSTGGRS